MDTSFRRLDSLLWGQSFYHIFLVQVQLASVYTTQCIIHVWRRIQQFSRCRSSVTSPTHLQPMCHIRVYVEVQWTSTLLQYYTIFQVFLVHSKEQVKYVPHGVNEQKINNLLHNPIAFVPIIKSIINFNWNIWNRVYSYNKYTCIHCNHCLITKPNASPWIPKWHKKHYWSGQSNVWYLSGSTACKA